MKSVRMLIAALAVLLIAHHALPATSHESMGADGPEHSLAVGLLVGCLAVAAATPRLFASGSSEQLPALPERGVRRFDRRRR